MVEETQKIEIGAPCDPKLMSRKGTLGPIVCKQQYARVTSFVQQAIAEGAELLTGGKRPAHLPVGYFVEPTILKVTPQHKIWREEVFGPVLAVLTFKTEMEALKLANDSEYGLAAAIMTNVIQSHFSLPTLCLSLSLSSSSSSSSPCFPFVASVEIKFFCFQFSFSLFLLCRCPSLSSPFPLSASLCALSLSLSLARALFPGHGTAATFDSQVARRHCVVGMQSTGLFAVTLGWVEKVGCRSRIGAMGDGQLLGSETSVALQYR